MTTHATIELVKTHPEDVFGGLRRLPTKVWTSPGAHMTHIDSRRQRRRSKGLDMANISVKGRHGHAHSKHKRVATRMHRRRLNQQVRGLKFISCGLPYGCTCTICPDRDLYLPDHIQRRMDTFQPCVSNHDVLGGVIAIGRHAARNSASFDQWFSWMKSYFPDTLAGRHALDHVVEDLRGWSDCSCINRATSSKRNFRACTCGGSWFATGEPDE